MTDYTDYTVSIHYDRRLFRHDIAGSIAHARMLGRQGIIPAEDAETIISGLKLVEREIEAGDFSWDPSLEDLHMNIERRLTELVGPVGGRLHTGRSRNDQIALDMRLYTRDAIRETVTDLRGVQRALLGLAEKYSNTLMPGYTHPAAGAAGAVRPPPARLLPDVPAGCGSLPGLLPKDGRASAGQRGLWPAYLIPPTATSWRKNWVSGRSPPTVWMRFRTGTFCWSTRRPPRFA